jgi:hypothetical protein
MASKSNLAIAPNRRPEAELLLSCARTRMKPATAQRLRQALKETIDWNYLIREAFYHGTIPLLFWNLSRLVPDDVPKTTLDQLKASSNAIACWNLFLTGELLELLNLFREGGIRALPLKGPVLAASAYGNLSLRQFCDLDILVSKEDMLKAKEVLISQGYHPDLKLTAGEEEAYLKSHHDYKFLKSEDSVVVEIQWGITQWFLAFPLDFDDLWKRRQKMSLAGAEVASLAPDDLLLILSVHGTKHQWSQLKWVCDIAEFVRTYSDKIDWKCLLARARMKGGERMVLLGLSLAQDLLGAECPKEIRERLNENQNVKYLVRQVSGKLFSGGVGSQRLRDETPFFYWRSRERWQDKLAILRNYLPGYFFRIVIPNRRDQEFWQLPRFLWGLYYTLRPIRLIYNHWSRHR